MSAPPAALSFGRYGEPVLLGKGGMGAVYRATDPLLGRHVAIKVLTQRDPKYVERFRREAQVLARIAHPAIIQIYEIVGADDSGGDPYIVMEFFDGRALDAVLKEGPLAPQQAVPALRQIGEGLRKAHANSIVHRDIKPANIMLSSAGEVKILDFGIAKMRDATTDLTGDAVLGTPYYMSPEQALGQPVDARTDIYSLGITAFHLLAGRRPFEAKNKVDAMMMQVKTPLPDLRQFAAHCDERVAGIVARMCAKKPAERYQDCDELLGALEALPQSLGGKQQDSPAAPDVASPKTLVMARPHPPAETAPPLARPPAPAEAAPLPARRAERAPQRTPERVPEAPRPAIQLAKARSRPRPQTAKRTRALTLGGGAAFLLLGVAAWALGAQRSFRGRVPIEGWHRAGGLKRLHAAGYSNCVFSSRAVERGREEDAELQQSFTAAEPIHGRCYFPAALGPNHPGEIWQEIWIDGAKRAQVIYDPPIPPEEDQVPLELSSQQASRLRDLSVGKHTLSVWIYRRAKDSDHPTALAAGELLVRK